ncbi:MAG: protein kinase domain-containing protein, partial [Gemmatimonadales bacterium]
MSDELLERLRRALAPRYEVERELASGGMGTVFLGRDVPLDKRVAIKVLRPELASERSVERFRREARTLANLRHPSIVTVHHADDADGLPFYTMDYLVGETLEDRLARDGLAPGEVIRMARDLLGALEVAHAHGVVHRDIKPSNIFLEDGQAVLVDFGIAKSLRGDQTPLTQPDGRAITPGWAPPEQATGGSVTPRTDLYALGMVLYRALTGRHWDIWAPPEGPDWSGVPTELAGPLKRALAYDPDHRWPDAASFRRALSPTPGGRWIHGAVGAATAIAAALLGWVFWPEPPAAGVPIRIEGFALSGELGAGFGDSLTTALVRSLARYPDLLVRGPGDPAWRGRRPRTVLGGMIAATGEQLRVEVSARGGRPLRVLRAGPAVQWRALVDSLADGVFAQLLALEALPAAVLPKTPPGMAAFVEAERLFTQARWGEAYAGYGAAAALDTACWICYWRHDEVGRWLSLAHDTVEGRRIRANITAFPPHYQTLIRAEPLPIAARLEALQELTRRSPEFLFGQFRYADELLHRGPLVGRPRRAAIAPFHEVVRLRSDFGPAWEHLAWAHIAEGDSADAARALTNLQALGPPQDLTTAGLRGLLQVAFAWRFQRPDDARQVSRAAIQQVERLGVTDLDAGARLLAQFEAPRGALEFGRLIVSRPALERSALLAQALGHQGLGRSDSAQAILRELVARYPEPDLELFGEEVGALQLLSDGEAGDPDGRRAALERTLAERAALQAATADGRRRAAWLLNLLTVGEARPAGDARILRGLLDDEPAPRRLGPL